jgi:hypothetical protein
LRTAPGTRRLELPIGSTVAVTPQAIGVDSVDSRAPLFRFTIQ